MLRVERSREDSIMAMQNPLISPTPDDLVAAQLRLAKAKDADDRAQADLRAARADATAAKKEQASALRGWRQILREMGTMPDDAFEDDPETDNDDEEDDEDEDEDTDETVDQVDDEPVPAGARRRAGRGG
jgi:hypothetical protein